LPEDGAGSVTVPPIEQPPGVKVGVGDGFCSMEAIISNVPPAGHATTTLGAPGIPDGYVPPYIPA